MPNLDRFGVGRPDPQDTPEAVYHCQDCTREIQDGEIALEFSGGIWCSASCLAESVATTFTVGEDEL